MKTKVILLMMFLFAAITVHAQKTNSQQARNIETARKIFIAFDKGDVDAFDNLVAQDAREHSEMPPQITSKGLQALKDLCRLNNLAFPDMKSTIHAIAATGDTVLAFMTSEGTHKGDYFGMPATNKHFKADGVDIIRFENGKAVEHWGVFDALTMMRQLGMMPPPPPAPAKPASSAQK